MSIQTNTISSIIPQIKSTSSNYDTTKLTNYRGYRGLVIGTLCLDRVNNILLEDSCGDPYLSDRHFELFEDGHLQSNLTQQTDDPDSPYNWIRHLFTKDNLNDFTLVMYDTYSLIIKLGDNTFGFSLALKPDMT